MTFSRIAVVGCIVVACVTQSCRKRGEETLPVSNYHAITVVDGGTISGTVTIGGGVPVIPPLEINHDNDACGNEHVSPRLVCAPSGAVQYAVVYLTDVHEGAALSVPAQPLTITQHGCMYEPHLTIAPRGATIAVANDDRNVLHNVHMLIGDTTIWNQAQPMYQQVNTHRMDRPGLITMRCDAGHIWMSGYVWVTEHPYYAVTDDSGRYTISSVPPGTYTLVCWHEGWNTTAVRDTHGDLTAYTYDAPHEERRRITVAAGTPATADFVITQH